MWVDEMIADRIRHTSVFNARHKKSSQKASPGTTKPAIRSVLVRLQSLTQSSLQLQNFRQFCVETRVYGYPGAFCLSPLPRGARSEHQGVHVVTAAHHGLLAEEHEAGHGEEGVPKALLAHRPVRVESHEVDRRVLAYARGEKERGNNSKVKTYRTSI